MRCTVLLAWLGLVAFTPSAFGADLFRIRLASNPNIYPGCQADLVFLIDHLRMPLPPGPPDPAKKIDALTFGVQLPSPLIYVSHSYSGTYLRAFLGQDPDYSAVRPVTGGATVAIVPDLEMAVAIPEGASQSVLKIRVTVPGGTPLQTIPVSFVGNLGSPAVPVHFSLPQGILIPTVQNGSVRVVSGTCSIRALGGFYGAAVGQLSDEAAPPAAEPDPTDDFDWGDHSNPAALDFPEPTEAELEVVWLVQYAEASPARETARAGMVGANLAAPPTPSTAVNESPLADGPEATAEDASATTPTPRRDAVRRLMEYAFGVGPPPLNSGAADIDKDGRVTIADAHLLARWQCGETGVAVAEVPVFPDEASVEPDPAAGAAPAGSE